jgi:hypothetical protein
VLWHFIRAQAAAVPQSQAPSPTQESLTRQQLKVETAIPVSTWLPRESPGTISPAGHRPARQLAGQCARTPSLPSSHGLERGCRIARRAWRARDLTDQPSPRLWWPPPPHHLIELLASEIHSGLLGGVSPQVSLASSFTRGHTGGRSGPAGDRCSISPQFFQVRVCLNCVYAPSQPVAMSSLPSSRYEDFLRISAVLALENWRRRPDLNRGWRFCRPLPYHLATAPIGDLGLSAEARGDAEGPTVAPPAPRRTAFAGVPGAKAGAGNGIRTRDFDLGKVALYH